MGVEIPETTGPATDEPNRALYEAVAFAADYFQQQLESPAGEGARRYLEGRGITQAATQRFLMGWAPSEWRALREAAQHHGITNETLLAAGLIKENEQAEEPYDRFRERIMFTVADATGRLVAFGGRALRVTEKVPKYLNSPETAIYHKGLILYGLNWSKAAIRREGAALVVEGYMDYVSLAARGIENVVAGMGTALTAEQANLLARYTAKACLLYDSDGAGRSATFRSADALLRTGVHPLVVTLPEGEDPDSLVRKRGAEALRPLIDNAVDVLDRKLQMLEERGYFSDIDHVTRALDRLLPTIRATIDPALRDIYVTRVAERTGVRRETLEHQVQSGDARPGPARYRPSRPPSPGRSASRGSRPSPVLRESFAAEKLLLLLLLRDRPRREQAGALLQAGEFSDAANRELFTALLEDGESGELKLSAVASLRRDELQRDPVEVTDADQSFDDAVAGIKAADLNRRIDELDVRMAGTRSDTERAAIFQARQATLQQLRQLGAAAELGFKVSRRYGRNTRGRAGPASTSTEER